MTTEMPGASAPDSLRALIAELAQIEDAVRRTRALIRTSNDGSDPVLNPELLELFRRQAQVVAALRQVRTTPR